MKKPKDIQELANRLSSAATAPLVVPTPAQAMPVAVATSSEPVAVVERPVSVSAKRKAPNRATVPVFLRISQTLYERYDAEAVRRTKESGRGVTVQQVILDRLGQVKA